MSNNAVVKPTILKLITQDSQSCVKLLNYIHKNLNKLVDMGVKFRIEKISDEDLDEDMVQKLSRKGIVRLPALITPDGSLFIGVGSIVKLFEKNLSDRAVDARIAPPSGDDYSEYMMSMMYSRDKNGGAKPITGDDDDGMGEGTDDIAAKMANYARNIPKHRGTGTDTSARPSPVGRPPRRQPEPMSDDEYEEPAPRRGRSTNNNLIDEAVASSGAEAELDRRMLEAMMNNM